jgi:hypothetical protein
MGRRSPAPRKMRRLDDEALQLFDEASDEPSAASEAI